MNTKNIIVICITILLIVGIITYGIVVNELQETPYEQCLKTCEYADKLMCVKYCTQEFGEVINKLIESIIPLINKSLNNNCVK